MAIVIEQQPAALSAAGNRLYFVVASDKSGYAGYAMTAKLVFEEPGGTLSEIPAMKLYPNGGGKADLEVSRVVHQRLKPFFPALTEKGFTKLTGFSGRFKVVFSEKWNGGTSPAVESAMVTVVKGKFAANQTVTGFVQAGNYLTNGGNMVETVAEGVHYLTALFLKAGSYTVKLKAVYVDGTVEHRSLGYINAAVNEVYAIPAGLKHLVFERQPERYSIVVQNGSGVEVFREVTFRVRRMVKKYRAMLYLNVAGGIDTVVVSDMSETMKTERESYRVDGARLLSLLTDYTDTFEATTGYVTEEAAKQIRELLISDQVYLVHMDSLVGVNVEKGSYKLFSEDADLQSVAFKYSFAEADYPVLNDDGGGVVPEPEPEPEPEPDPEPDGYVVACCPDGVDDYLGITTANGFSIAQVCPSLSGMKFVYTIDMIPAAGYTFSIGRSGLFYLGLMYVGGAVVVQVFSGGKSLLVYQETAGNYEGLRVNVVFGVENTGTEIKLDLKINGLSEALNVIDVTGDENYSPTGDFFELFRTGIAANPQYGSSKIISFAVDHVSSATTRKVLWNFEGATAVEKLKNKVSGASYDLVAKNVASMDEFIKSVPFKY